MEIKYNLAQINIARMLAPIESPVMADFVANLDLIYELDFADEGFIWMYKPEENEGKSLRIFDDDFLIANLSVWSSADALFNYVYRSGHIEVFKRRKEWFEKIPEIYMALWYIPKGETPTPEQARARLLYLRQNGETPYSFSFKKRFTMDESAKFQP